LESHSDTFVVQGWLTAEGFLDKISENLTKALAA